jgi:hypothetical protein
MYSHMHVWMCMSLRLRMYYIMNERVCLYVCIHAYRCDVCMYVAFVHAYICICGTWMRVRPCTVYITMHAYLRINVCTYMRIDCSPTGHYNLTFLHSSYTMGVPHLGFTISA